MTSDKIRFSSNLCICTRIKCRSRVNTTICNKLIRLSKNSIILVTHTNDRTQRCPILCIVRGTYFKHRLLRRAKDLNLDKRIHTTHRVRIRCLKGHQIDASLSKLGQGAILSNSTTNGHNTPEASRSRKTEILADTFLRTQIH